jgi:hypothetical protein
MQYGTKSALFTTSTFYERRSKTKKLPAEAKNDQKDSTPSRGFHLRLL